MDDYTLLVPDDSGALAACFIIAALVGAASGVALYRQLVGSVAARWTSALRGGLLAALITGVVTWNLPDYILGRIYFPTDKTVTFEALLPIGRAYKAPSRSGKDWIIQPTPLWTNINITKSDYDSLAANMRVTDVSGEPESVSMRGTFCARVTMQTSGDALRVLHTGGELPQGSVIRCPTAAMGQPYLKLH